MNIADPSPEPTPKANLGDSEVGSPVGTNEVDKQCFGCNRSYLYGRSWVNPAERVTWYSGGRGNWCHDCFCAWRTVYSQDHSTLAFFHQWVEAEPPRRSEWETVLVSYLSLVVEGHARITSPMVHQRVRSVQFVMRMFGIPSTSFVSMVLPVAAGLGFDQLDANALLTMDIGGASRIGVLVPYSVTAPRPSQVQRPGGPFGVPGLPSRALLTSTDPNDRALMSQLFGGGGANSEATDIVAREPAESLTPPSTTKKNKLEIKCEAVLAAPKKICKAFASAGWDDVKESAVTSALQKLRNLYDEAANSGNKDAIEQIELWIGGMCSVKQFIKAHRDFDKSNAKISKLMDMLEPLTRFELFMQSVAGLSLAPGAALMLAKMRFFDEAPWHDETCWGLDRIETRWYSRLCSVRSVMVYAMTYVSISEC